MERCWSFVKYTIPPFSLPPSFFLPHTQYTTQNNSIPPIHCYPFYRTPVLVWPRPGTYRERGRRRDGPTGIHGKREEPRLGSGDSFAHHVVWGTDFSHLLRFQIRQQFCADDVSWCVGGFFLCIMYAFIISKSWICSSLTGYVNSYHTLISTPSNLVLNPFLPPSTLLPWGWTPYLPPLGWAPPSCTYSWQWTLPSPTDLGVPENGERSLKILEVGWKIPEQLAATNHPCLQSNESCSQLCLGDDFNEKVRVVAI